MAVNIHEAKTQLSKLIEEASKGESFVIAKAGKPVVKVTALSAPTGDQVRRLGFMAGQISGRWPGQSGKELVVAKRFLHPERERQATEVGRYGSGVLLERRSLAWSQVPCAEQWLTVGATQLIPFGRVSSIAQLGRCLQLRKRATSEKDTER